jgi:hypothetical protein
LDLQYCYGQKRYDFSTDEGVYYLDCDTKYYHIGDISPQAFRRAYVAALFGEEKRWLTAIEKYQLLVPGSAKNSRDKAKDLALKERIAEQASPGTYKDRKRFYEAWKEASCCANDCDQYCDQCSNKGIKFKPIPAHGLDPDIRRFITKYGRYQTASELERENNAKRKESKLRSTPILSGVRDRKGNDDPIWVRGQERGELPGEPEEVASDQAERVEAMLSHPFSEEMVT